MTLHSIYIWREYQFTRGRYLRPVGRGLWKIHADWEVGQISKLQSLASLAIDLAGLSQPPSAWKWKWKAIKQDVIAEIDPANETYTAVAKTAAMEWIISENVMEDRIGGVIQANILSPIIILIETWTSTEKLQSLIASCGITK